MEADNLSVLLKEIDADTVEEAIDIMKTWKELLSNVYSFILTIKDGSPILIQRFYVTDTDIKWVITKNNQSLCRDKKEFSEKPENPLFDNVLDAIAFGQFLS